MKICLPARDTRTIKVQPHIDSISQVFIYTLIMCLSVDIAVRMKTNVCLFFFVFFASLPRAPRK